MTTTSVATKPSESFVNRRTHIVSMVCGHPRRVQGWRLTNLGRAFNVVWNSYQRGNVSFHYERAQHYGREFLADLRAAQVRTSGEVARSSTSTAFARG